MEEFIDYSRGYMQYIAYKYIIDKSLVEDVLFLAYSRILQVIQTFDSSLNGLAWILKITKNEAYKLNQNEITKNISSEEYENTCLDDSFNENDNINKYDIERAIERLDEQERSIIEYKIFMGMTIRETAKQMNMPKSTTAYILKQALIKLEKYLD